MKAPRTVTVGPTRYTVVYEDDPRGDDGKTYLWGETIYDEARIRLRRGMDPAFERTILWHEICHAISYVTGAGYAANADQSSEEIMIRNLAPTQVDVLRRNPKLVAYLTGA